MIFEITGQAFDEKVYGEVKVYRGVVEAETEAEAKEIGEELTPTDENTTSVVVYVSWTTPKNPEPFPVYSYTRQLYS